MTYSISSVVFWLKKKRGKKVDLFFNLIRDVKNAFQNHRIFLATEKLYPSPLSSQPFEITKVTSPGMFFLSS